MLTKSIGAPYTQAVSHTNARRNRHNMILHRIGKLFPLPSGIQSRAGKGMKLWVQLKREGQKTLSEGFMGYKSRLFSKKI